MPSKGSPTLSPERPEQLQQANDSDGSSGPSSPQRFCLRWNYYPTSMTSVFNQLLQSESFVDVTLACDGHNLKAHKMILSACSPYFQSLFFENPCQHPIVIMRDIKWPELKAVIEFMYKGEINVSQDEIGPILGVAKFLKIRGLADVNADRDAANMTPSSPPIKKDAPSTVPSKRDQEEAPAPKIRKRQHSVSARVRSPGSSPPCSSVATPHSSTSQSLPLVPIRNDTEPSITETVHDERLSSDGGGTLSFDGGDRLSSDMLSLCNEIQMAKNLENNYDKPKAPTWSQKQLQLAIDSVVKQKMRFSQAATKFNIPKGTIYDNILGKKHRMAVLEETGLLDFEERQVLEYCCDVTSMPHNRRTRRPLKAVLTFVQTLRRIRDPTFTFTDLDGFRWWWAFCKKHAIISLHYKQESSSSTLSVSPGSSSEETPISGSDAI